MHTERFNLVVFEFWLVGIDDLLFTTKVEWCNPGKNKPTDGLLLPYVVVYQPWSVPPTSNNNPSVFTNPIHIHPLVSVWWCVQKQHFVFLILCQPVIMLMVVLMWALCILLLVKAFISWVLPTKLPFFLFNFIESIYYKPKTILLMFWFMFFFFKCCFFGVSWNLRAFEFYLIFLWEKRIITSHT